MDGCACRGPARGSGRENRQGARASSKQGRGQGRSIVVREKRRWMAHGRRTDYWRRLESGVREGYESLHTATRAAERRVEGRRAAGNSGIASLQATLGGGLARRCSFHTLLGRNLDWKSSVGSSRCFCPTSATTLGRIPDFWSCLCCRGNRYWWRVEKIGRRRRSCIVGTVVGGLVWGRV